MNNLRQVSLCFLIKDKKVLLAMKKRGFGSGKYNGVGGKKNPDETIEEAAIRETHEEIGVKVKDIKAVGIIDFYFKENNEFDQQVVVFVCKSWEGNPVESEEMSPFWFKFDEIPYEQMWVDDVYWLPKVLKGEKIKAKFIFDKDENLIDSKIELI